MIVLGLNFGLIQAKKEKSRNLIENDMKFQFPTAAPWSRLAMKLSARENLKTQFE